MAEMLAFLLILLKMQLAGVNFCFGVIGILDSLILV